MNFKQTIEQMGYDILDKNPEQIIIHKEIDHCHIRIAFFLEGRKIHGIVQPFGVIMKQNDINRLQAIWDISVKDVKTLSELSKYDIME